MGSVGDLVSSVTDPFDVLGMQEQKKAQEAAQKAAQEQANAAKQAQIDQQKATEQQADQTKRKKQAEEEALRASRGGSTAILGVTDQILGI